MSERMSTSSGLKTADAVIIPVSGSNVAQGLLTGVVLRGAAGDSIVLYDNATAASGLVLAKIVLEATGTESQIYNVPIIFNNGIYADVTLAGAGDYIVYYSVG